MAIRKLNAATIDPIQADELRAALVAELRRPDAAPAAPGAPVIYREESRTAGVGDYTHWYAVWDRFESVEDREERSRLLCDAIREVYGANELLRVTMAMGLTPKEAEGMGLED